MNLITVVIIGIIQGILEWLPVSSQGIITAILVLLGENPQTAIDYALMLHLGTALSALIYYRKEFHEMIKEGTLLKFVIITTLISGLIGGIIYLTLKDLSRNIGTSVLAIIGVALIITGIMQLKKKKGLKNQPSNKDAIITGITQGFSIIPGISRSGTTISTLLIRGFKGEMAIKLSFILSVPLVLGAQVGLELMNKPVITWESIWGLMSAFITGLITINALTKIAGKVNFGKFCILMGAIMTLSIIL